MKSAKYFRYLQEGITGAHVLKNDSQHRESVRLHSGLRDGVVLDVDVDKVELAHERLPVHLVLRAAHPPVPPVQVELEEPESEKESPY